MRQSILSVPEFDLEYHQEDMGNGKFLTFLHLEVYRWSPSVFRQLKAIWPTVSTIARPLFLVGTRDTPLFHKFVSRFGFSPFLKVGCTDDQERTLFIFT